MQKYKVLMSFLSYQTKISIKTWKYYSTSTSELYITLQQLSKCTWLLPTTGHVCVILRAVCALAIDEKSEGQALIIWGPQTSTAGSLATVFTAMLV